MLLRKIFCSTLLISSILLSSVSAKENKPKEDVIFESKDPKVLELYKNVSKIFKDVQKIRSLPVKRPVKIGVKNTNQVNEFLKNNVKKEYPDKDVKKDTLFLKKLGLIPETFDLKNTFIDLYTQQIAGFYDSDTKSLYVVNDKKKSSNSDLESSIVISHELVHSLQDQYFNIKYIMQKDKDNDKYLAKSALIEGEATFVSMQYIIENMGLKKELLPNLGDLMKKTMSKSGNQGMENIPGFMFEQMMFPYIEGMRFSEYIYKKSGSWDKFNSVYKYLPESTEQIMHPEKYIKKEKPLKVYINPYFLNDWKWKLLDYDTMGEFSVMNWLLEFNNQKDAERAAEGWGGDKYAFFSKNDKENIFVYKSLWDTQKDSDEFFDTLKDTLKYRYQNNLHIEVDDNSTFFARSKEGYIYAVKKNKSVNLADGFPKDFEKRIKNYLNK